MTVDDILDMYDGDFVLYDLDNDCIIYDSCNNSIDDLCDYDYETVSYLEVDNNKLFINI